VNPGSPLTSRGDGIELALKVTPRAGRAAIEGAVVDAAGAAWLAVKVTAPPEDGRANAAVLERPITAVNAIACASREIFMVMLLSWSD